MKSITLSAAMLALLCTGCASTEGSTTRIAVQAGARMLESDGWEPLDEQPMIGIDVAMVDAGGVGAEYGLDYSHDTADGPGASAESTSDWAVAYVGVRKSFLPEHRDIFIPGGGRMIPYVSLGVAGVYARSEVSTGGSSVSADDVTFAGYVRAGTDFSLTKALFIGADVRYLVGGDFDLAGAEAESDSLSAALRLGWSF